MGRLMEGFDIVSYLMGHLMGKAAGGESEPGLIAGYQAIEYIEYTAPIGFGVKIPTDFEGYAEAAFSTIPDTTARSVLGYRESTSNNADFAVQGKNGKWEGWARGASVAPITDSINITAGEKIACTYWVKGVRSDAYIGAYAFYSSTVQENAFDGRIYLLKGWSIEAPPQQALLFKFLPCIRKSDNTLGWFEAVSKTFYSETTGTGSVAAGPI